MSWENSGNAGGGWDGAGATSSFEEPAASNGFEHSGGEADGAGRFRGDSAGAGFGGVGNGVGNGVGSGCYNCGEDGHMKSDCPNPAIDCEFTGTCRLCEEQGHRAADCPTKPPQQCKNCLEEGHPAFECKNPRSLKLMYEDVEEIPAEQAWAKMNIASNERDLDEFKDSLKKYLKATPDITYPQLEGVFRRHKFNVYLIAIEKQLAVAYTNVDLQGNLDKQFTVSCRLSPYHQRPKEKDSWPATPEENLTRLENAGKAIDRGVPKCTNCEQLGHAFKSCPEEKQENADRTVVNCYNCEEIGHRNRDCPYPRRDKFACRNCKQSGHSSKECTEPRSAEGVECKKCNEIGHFSRNCPQGGGGGGGGECRNCGQEGHRAKECTEPRKLICRNCDEEGHTGKECLKPRDYSRVKCSNCQEMGHTKVRCKQLIVDEDAASAVGGYGSGAGGHGRAGSGDYGDVDKFSAAPAPIAVGGGWEGGQHAASGW